MLNRSFNSLSKFLFHKRFNSLCHVMFQEKFNSLSHTLKCSILEVMLKKKVQFCESSEKQFLEHIFKKKVWFFGSYYQKSSILWLIFFGKSIPRIIFFSFSRKFEFFDAFFQKKKKVQVFESIVNRRFNSLSYILEKVSVSHVRKKFNSLSHIGKEGSIRWLILKKSSMLWVIFNSLSQIEKKNNP